MYPIAFYFFRRKPGEDFLQTYYTSKAMQTKYFEPSNIFIQIIKNAHRLTNFHLKNKFFPQAMLLQASFFCAFESLFEKRKC